jgi:hypothetical protein
MVLKMVEKGVFLTFSAPLRKNADKKERQGEKNARIL